MGILVVELVKWLIKLNGWLRPNYDNNMMQST